MYIQIYRKIRRIQASNRKKRIFIKRKMRIIKERIEKLIKTF